MEYLAPEHQDLAQDGLDELREKLPSAQQNALENVKAKDIPFPRTFRIAEDFTSRNLPTAQIIWEYMVEKATNKQQKFAVMNKLFQVQIATGPWKVALETAQKLFQDTVKEYSSETLSGQTAKERGLEPFMTAPLLFDAALNLGTIHRLLKELNKAELLYRRAWNIAASVRDFDRETLAKIHLAISLLDRGELKEAIDTYFEPLMAFKTTMKPRTRALYLQHYGNACRSAADWGRAKEYLREAVDLAKEVKDVGLVSSCCGDLGNVFRSEGRYKDAQQLHTIHHKFTLSRGDIHGLAIACGNIGFLKFYNAEEFDDSVVYQFIEYSLAEQVGDFARMGIAFNKIGKLYTTLGYNEEAVEMFKIALDSARKADNVAGEGMAWGNLGTVYRALERFDDAIDCHVKYRDNAERRMDIGGVAIMQHQLAMDYFLNGKLPEAERSVLDAFQTLEKIRSQIGEEDKSKLSNFEKNQAEAHNLLQVVLVAQGKFEEALVLADASRGRALAEIVRKRLSGCISAGAETTTLNEEFIAESFNNLVEVARKLSTTLIFYSVVREFDQSGAFFTWVYAWVLLPSGGLHFSKARLQHGIEMKVEVNDEFVVSLRRSMGRQHSELEDVCKILRSCEKKLKVSREAKVLVAAHKGEDVLSSLKGLEHVFATHADDDNSPLYSSWDIPYKTKETGIQDRMAFQRDIVATEIDPTHYELKTSQSKEIGQETIQRETKDTAITVENKALEDSTGSPEICSLEVGTVAGNPVASIEPCYVEIPESHEVSNREEACSSESLNESDIRKQSVAVDTANVIPETFPHIFERQEEDPEDDSKTQSVTHAEVLEESVTNCDVPKENTPGPTELSETHTKLETSNSEKCSASLHSENPTNVEKDELSPLAPSEENLQRPLNAVMAGTHLESNKAKGEMLSASLPSDNHIEKEKDKLSLVTTSHDVSGSTSLDLVGDTAAKPSDETFSASLQSDFKVEVEKDEQSPVKAGDDVSEDKLSGPLNDVLTEPLVTHAKEPNDERQSDPELDPWRPMLSQLHKILIEPIIDFLPKKDENQRVTFIPQDFLLKVPFAALQGNARDNYFMEDFIISTSPAIHFLELACASRETAERTTAPLELSLFAVGNPIMPFKELPQLPSAQREVRMINKIINSPGSEILIGSQAKKTEVMRAMPKHKILHFATHAIIDDADSHGDFSMKGFIVLAKSGLECSGILTAEEVRGMELNAELVVLSCCDTGLGKVTGDGVLGLSRAFLAAGAACVIVTLWKIDDQSASELMTSFYREYKASRDAAVSLQKAMKILQAKEDTRSPQHWAAFSIVGATGV